jgi:hypothetical protein
LDDGKRVEKALMAKFKDGAVARRENDPAFSQLNSRSVDDPQKAADEVQPAAVPGK